MEIQKYYFNKKNTEQIAVAIGNFDGFHLGHEKLINTLSKTKQCTAVMFFDPHPNSIFNQNHQELMSPLEKINFLKDKVDMVFVVKFDLDFANLTIGDFIDELKKLNVNTVVVGSNFRFANNKSGTIKDLEKHFEVIKVNEELYGNEVISSTRLKNCLKNGNLEVYQKLTNTYYSISGIVVDGMKLGATLGFPTANIMTDNLLPSNGVYLVNIIIDDQKFTGICNIGTRPTINNDNEKKVEVYILNFDNNIYRKKVKVELVSKIRDEIKFNNLEDLKNQIQQDVEYVKKLVE